jgi:hypothetical protein
MLSRNAKANDEVSFECASAMKSASSTDSTADTKRLDFLEKHPRCFNHATGYLGGKDKWTWMDAGHVIREADSLREAIDAAIREFTHGG